MKEGIHPKYYDVEARCACGATWKTRSTKPELHLEICSSCHPFFTGKQKLLDTEGRVERFTKKYGAQTSESRKTAAKRKAKAKKEAAAATATLNAYRRVQSSTRAARTTAAYFRIRIQQQLDRSALTRHLPLDPRQPMLTAAPATAALRDRQTPQRERLRQRQIAHAVLVVNRQRLGRLAHDRRRTAAHLEQLPPAARPPRRAAARGGTRAPARAAPRS